jgi:hypothetical protein
MAQSMIIPAEWLAEAGMQIFGRHFRVSFATRRIE